MSSLAGSAPAAAPSAGGLAALLRGVERVLDVGARSHARALALLLALGLACVLPGLVSLQPMDRDEPRFAQASKQMLESGDLVDIRFQGEARHKKPVGIYWAQAATVAAAQRLGVPNARGTIALYRIPSVLGALAAGLLTYWAALAVLPHRGALLASALFTASTMLAAEAHLAKTDALLAACAVAAMGALLRAWLRREPSGAAPVARGTALAFWAAMALGILIKGPMVPLFAGLAAAALSVRARSARWLLALRPLAGLALTLVVVAPWFAAIAWKTGGAFYGEAVGHDMLGKVGGGAERHGGPPGFYALAFFATFWPGAAFAALAIPFAWRHRGEAAVAFLLAWIVPAWLLLEIVPTKLPHYVLPLMPAAAILAVLAATRGALAPDRRGARAAAALVVLIPVALTLGLCAFAWTYDDTLPYAGLPLLLAACAVAGLAWTAFARAQAESALALAVAAGALLAPAVFGLTQPALAALKVSPRLAAIRDALPCPAPRTASLGVREPSLVFLIGTDLALPATVPETLAFLREGGCRLAFVEDRFAAAFAASVAAERAGAETPVAVGRVEGFAINGGRRVAVRAWATGLPEADRPAAGTTR